MSKTKKNWRRLFWANALASGLLTILLYGFVFTNMLSEALAIPWAIMRQNVLIVDWTCLFIALFALAIFIGFNISLINGIKGIMSGFILGLISIVIGTIAQENIYGIGYYILCYAIWGLCLGIITHEKKHLIIRRF